MSKVFSNKNKISDMILDKSTLTAIITSPSFKDLSKENKKYINNLADKMVIDFICKMCNYKRPINKTYLLYRSNTEDSQLITNKKALAENKLICQDFLLQHIKSYNCINSACITNNKPELKDAVLYKKNNSYRVTYICCVCHHDWITMNDNL